MTKQIDLTIDKCVVCKHTEVYLHAGTDANGSVYKNDVCIDCEEKAHGMMDQKEAIQTLYRWTYGDKF